MRKLFTVAVTLFLSVSLWAQSPQKISYQAVIRNNNNQLVVNQKVGMQIIILQGSATGTEVYSESQTPTTNANGLVSIAIGIESGFADIDWSTGSYFIKTEIDPAGGTNYSIIGTSQLLSVPYALYAKTAGNNIAGPKGEKGDQGIQGEQGVKGDTGLQGIAGKNGTDGKSAYQLWLQAGNTGDTSAFLLGGKGLTGDKGAIGDKGLQGDQGIQGLPGDQGLTGDKGATGDQGPIGLQGATGTKGLNGDKGATGDQGPIGLQGPTGLTGLQGATGATGLQGATGTKGATGDNGAPGISIVWKGTLTIAPTTPIINWAYYNSTDKISYIYNGTAWVILAQDGAKGIDGLTTSVNGITQVGGAITLTKANIGLTNVDNTSDVNKPISTATQTALNLKANSATTLAGYNISNAVDITSNQSIAGNKIFTGTTTVSDITAANTSVANLTVSGTTTVATPVNATDATTKAYVDALKTQIKSLQDVLITGGTVMIDNDGNLYPTVKIGSQIWMESNLKTTTYNDGTAIPNVPDATTWGALTTGAMCDINNTPATSIIYGKFYNWFAVNTAKLCPIGWHVPTDTEWETLSTTLGGDQVSGGALKESGTSHWSSSNLGATNSSGFTAFGSGYRDNTGKLMFFRGIGTWWSATNGDILLITNSGLNTSTGTSATEADGMTVRCLKD
jgi:uncharacterized protein (TIGR02145 family)